MKKNLEVSKYFFCLSVELQVEDSKVEIRSIGFGLKLVVQKMLLCVVKFNYKLGLKSHVDPEILEREAEVDVESTAS